MPSWPRWPRRNEPRGGGPWICSAHMPRQMAGILSARLSIRGQRCSIERRRQARFGDAALPVGHGSMLWSRTSHRHGTHSAVLYPFGREPSSHSHSTASDCSPSPVVACSIFTPKRLTRSALMRDSEPISVSASRVRREISFICSVAFDTR